MDGEGVIRWCRALAQHTEQPGLITRTFVSAPMKDVHRDLLGWMTELGMIGTVDAAANLRGLRRSARRDAPCLYLGSHLDTVPDAGAFDGILGVVWALAVIEALGDTPLECDLEVIGFSEEEGVRFGAPFIGSRALVGSLDDELLGRRDANGISVEEALRAFGSDIDALDRAVARTDALGYLECHIEQGPSLDARDRPLGLVQQIAGQTRAEVTFTGVARHAGTTPMLLRRDAVAGAAEWVNGVERLARETAGAVATVGRIDVTPGAGNVIAGHCRCSLDIRHADDAVRVALVDAIRQEAQGIAARRGLSTTWNPRLNRDATPMHVEWTALLAQAGARAGYPLVPITSGAGHDAMVVASRMPAAMLFVRSPDGISHHPDETVRADDVTAAIAVGRQFIIDVSSSLHA